jgi:hypothetical protein
MHAYMSFLLMHYLMRTTHSHIQCVYESRKFVHYSGIWVIRSPKMLPEKLGKINGLSMFIV